MSKRVKRFILGREMRNERNERKRKQSEKYEREHLLSTNRNTKKNWWKIEGANKDMGLVVGDTKLFGIDKHSFKIDLRESRKKNKAKI